MMLFSAGCLGNDSDEKDAEDFQDDVIVMGCMDSSAINYDANATNSDPDSCEFSEDNSINLLSIPHTDGCDNTNPIHCMLPFPSDAFLVEDNSTVTGKRISYSANTIPRSGTVGQNHIPIINQFDGASPNTQIMTAFDSEPDVSEMAGQYNIEKSLEVGHSSMIINQDTGEIVPHWTELDVRSDDSEPTIIHLRTIKALDHDTSYVVLFSNLQDLDGKSLFSSKKDELPKELYYFLGGLQRYMREFSVLIAPTVNSYKRLCPGAWAPINMTWGIENRTTAFRAIKGDSSSQRIENRLPGADSNPYLALAATLGAGFLGIKEKIKPTNETIGGAYDLNVEKKYQVPKNLGEAANLFKNSEPAKELFGEDFVNHFANTRIWEYTEFQKNRSFLESDAVSPWELKRYFEII